MIDNAGSRRHLAVKRSKVKWKGRKLLLCREGHLSPAAQAYATRTSLYAATPPKRRTVRNQEAEGER